MEEEIEQFIEKKVEQGPEQIASEYPIIKTNDDITVTPDQMLKDIEDEEAFTPIPEDDIEGIREAHLKASITPIDDKTVYMDGEEDNKKFIEQLKKEQEKKREQIMAMTDEELVAWAKDANEKYRAILTIQKDFAKDLKSSELKVEDLEHLHENDHVRKSNWTPEALRRRFLRITNPNRKRGDPISKEPESAHRFLKQCKYIRGRMDFDKMSKLELKTRLIQTIAVQCIQLSDLEEKHQSESETDARVWRIEVEKMESRALDLLSKLNYERECIRRFFEKHPGHREEYNLICKKFESEFNEPKIADK